MNRNLDLNCYRTENFKICVLSDVVKDCISKYEVELGPPQYFMEVGAYGYENVDWINQLIPFSLTISV